MSDDDPTQVVPATAAAAEPRLGQPRLAKSGLDAACGGSGRAWFDQWLLGFTDALTTHEDGRPRTDLERRALATAAREMIARIGWGRPAGPALPPEAALSADQMLANTYQVRALIARGGVGEIYRTRHRDLRTDHAIKILLPRHALDTTLVTLMLNEARVLASIRHDGVVACHGLLRDTDERLMLVMDYLRGPTLAARLQQGPLSGPDLAALLHRLATTLAALHAQGVVHNDISPDNIILRDDDCRAATLIDFGLARSLADQEDTHVLVDFAGKYAWVSPEQLLGHDIRIDGRSDLYSLGLVIAAAALGRRLDMGHDLASARAARAVVPSLDGIDPAVGGLLRRLLGPAPVDRFQTADNLLEAMAGTAARRRGWLRRQLDFSLVRPLGR